MLPIEELIIKLKEARNNSYAPYSKFYVGAVLECKDGTILLGSNVENASYGLAMCAERNVLFQAYNKGYRKGDFNRLSIIADSNEITFPCGACRQAIVELENITGKNVGILYDTKGPEFRNGIVENGGMNFNIFVFYHLRQNLFFYILLRFWFIFFGQFH